MDCGNVSKTPHLCIVGTFVHYGNISKENKMFSQDKMSSQSFCDGVSTRLACTLAGQYVHLYRGEHRVCILQSALLIQCGNVSKQDKMSCRDRMSSGSFGTGMHCGDFGHML